MRHCLKTIIIFELLYFPKHLPSAEVRPSYAFFEIWAYKVTYCLDSKARKPFLFDQFFEFYFWQSRVKNRNGGIHVSAYARVTKFYCQENNTTTGKGKKKQE